MYQGPEPLLTRTHADFSDVLVFSISFKKRKVSHKASCHTKRQPFLGLQTARLYISRYTLTFVTNSDIYLVHSIVTRVPFQRHNSKIDSRTPEPLLTRTHADFLDVLVVLVCSFFRRPCILFRKFILILKSFYHYNDNKNFSISFKKRKVSHKTSCHTKRQPFLGLQTARLYISRYTLTFVTNSDIYLVHSIVTRVPFQRHNSKIDYLEWENTCISILHSSNPDA